MSDHIDGEIRRNFGGIQGAVGEATGDDLLWARGKINQAAGAAQSAYGQAEDAAKQGYSSLSATFRDRPMAGLGLGLGVGLLFGLMLRRAPAPVTPRRH